MAASTFPLFMDALAAQLILRAGLSGVAVFTAPVAPENAGEEAIVLAPETSIEQTVAAMSSTDIEEVYDVKGLILVYHAQAPGATLVGTINAGAKAARDRAFAIFEEVVDQLTTDATVSGTVRDARTTTVTVQQGLAPEGQLGRVCQIEFVIQAEAHTTP
jgi:hypothetical protein